MALVNIPRDVRDEFHRYKMPFLIAKVEGRGNGIKTVIVNMADVAKSLDRPPEYVTKFFGFELGALTTIDPAKDRYIVNGKHDQPKLAQALDVFIDRFILCKKCVRNPETKMMTTKSGNIELHCKACGNRSPVDMRHKLAGYIIKNPPQDLASQKDKKKKEKDTKKSKKDNTGNGKEDDNGINGDEQPVMKASSRKKKKNDDEEEDDGVEWFTDTSKEAAEERRRQMLDNTSELAAKLLTGLKDRKNPLDELQKFVETNPSNEQIISEAKRIKEEEKFDDEQAASLLFVALYDKDIMKQLRSRFPILKEFTKNEKAQAGLLVGIEELCGVREQTLLKSVPHILKSLYDEDILEEEELYKWDDAPSKGTVAQVKAAGKIFVDWLRNAEEESEGEGEEEEDSEEAE